MSQVIGTYSEQKFKLVSDRTRSQRIKVYVDELKKEYPEQLEEELKLMYLRVLAKKINETTLPNDITMQEIVDEVNSVRKEMHENQSRI
jgi:pyruvate/oxaloacetate carboxyltransferase